MMFEIPAPWLSESGRLANILSSNRDALRQRPRKKMLRESAREKRDPPTIPTCSELVASSDEVTRQLVHESLHLQELQRERVRGTCKAKPETQRGKAPAPVHEYRGFLFSEGLLQNFQAHNSKRVSCAHSRFAVSSAICCGDVTDNLQYLRNMETHQENLPFMYTMLYQRDALIREQKMMFANHYVDLWKKWRQESCPAVESLSLLTHVCNSQVWGYEQIQQPTVPYEGVHATAGTAPDVEMRLDVELPAYNDYADRNAFVMDPVKSHKEYKTKTNWNDEDRRKFCKLFWKHPRKFGLLAKSFPNRTTKEMVEFYYLTKSSPEMIEAKSKYRRPSNGRRPRMNNDTPGGISYAKNG